jgi:hypothetical protein
MCRTPNGTSPSLPPFRSLLSEAAQELEVFLVFGTSSRLFHLDQVVQRSKPDKCPAEAGFDLVRPDPFEGGPFHEGMDVRFDNVLPDKELLGEQVIDADVRHVVAKRLESLARTLGVKGCRFDEDIGVQSGPGIPVDGKGGCADDDEPDLMFS